MTEHRYCESVRAEIARLISVVRSRDEEVEWLRTLLRAILDVECRTSERDAARALLRAILDEALCLSDTDGTCRQIERPHDEWCAICLAREWMEKVEP